MYTFDATWILIQALSKLSLNDSLPYWNRSTSCFRSFLKNYSTFHQHMENSHFAGLTGLVQFSKNSSNDRSEGVLYALQNMWYIRSNSTAAKAEVKRVEPMIWCQLLGEWEDVPGLGKKSIVWPNRSDETVPPDYRQLRGEEGLQLVARRDDGMSRVVQQ